MAERNTKKTSLTGSAQKRRDHVRFLVVQKHQRALKKKLGVPGKTALKLLFPGGRSQESAAMERGYQALYGTRRASETPLFDKSAQPPAEISV